MTEIILTGKEGATLNTRVQADILMYRIVLVLALMLAISLAGILTL
jgi:hypothetical protein